MGVQAQVPLLHGPLLQSPSAVHAWPVVHVAPQLPPQSTSVSAPFFTPSLHDADSQVFEVAQKPLAQSVLVMHALPSPHFGHCEPPQSTSVSSPSFMLFVHDRGAPVVSAMHSEPDRTKPVLQAKSHAVPLQSG